MTTKTDSATAHQADAFEVTLKAACVPTKHHDALWDVWVDDPARAVRMAQAYVTPRAATTKAAPGMAAVELPAALAAALASARAKLGDAQIAQLLTQATGAEAKGTTAGRNDKSATATKAAPRGFAGILDDVSAQLQRDPNSWQK
jgi:hypothetical protein